MKKFVSKIFKCTTSGKPDMEEAPHIEVRINTKIREKYNITPKNSTVDYDDMLLPLTKIFRVKNKCCPFRNWQKEHIFFHIGCIPSPSSINFDIERHHLDKGGR